MSINEYHKSMQDYRESLDSSSSPVLESVGSPSPEGIDALQSKLDVLSDPQADGDQRLASLLWLKVQAMTHKTAEQWQPQFLDAMRSASDADHDGLRHQAIETLVQHDDAETNQALLQGLEDQTKAKTSAAHALRLLSSNSHVAAHQAAREFAQQDDDVEAKEEALRVLANDPSFVNEFAALVPDDSQPESIRNMAATALNGLDQERLMQVAESMDDDAPVLEGLASAMESAPAKIKLHINALLKNR